MNIRPPRGRPPKPILVEEDGDEVATPMPERCTLWDRVNNKKCNGLVVKHPKTGFHICETCGASYGK